MVEKLGLLKAILKSVLRFICYKNNTTIKLSVYLLLGSDTQNTQERHWDTPEQPQILKQIYLHVQTAAPLGEQSSQLSSLTVLTINQDCNPRSLYKPSSTARYTAEWQSWEAIAVLCALSQ